MILVVHTLDVDTPLQTVDAGDLALTALLAAPNNGDLVVLADGNGADLLRIVLEPYALSVRVRFRSSSDVDIVFCSPLSRFQ